MKSSFYFDTLSITGARSKTTEVTNW